jgi:hypothetical protein
MKDQPGRGPHRETQRTITVKRDKTGGPHKQD